MVTTGDDMMFFAAMFSGSLFGAETLTRSRSVTITTGFLRPLTSTTEPALFFSIYLDTSRADRPSLSLAATVFFGDTITLTALIDWLYDYIF